MSDKELEEYIKKVEPNFDSHLEKGTIEMSNEYYNLLEEKMARLINKNKELNQKYENAENNDKVVDKVNWENQKLKKQNKTIQEKFKEWKKDIEKERKFYLCERDCAFRLKESKKYLSYTQQIEQLQKENQKLKKELEEYNRLSFKHLNDKCNKLENQQKEFVEWLENEKNIYPYDISDYTYEDIINTILSKYYEIIEK